MVYICANSVKVVVINKTVYTVYYIYCLSRYHWPQVV